MKRTREIAIIVIAPICYVIGALSVIRQDALVAMLFFCAESVLLVLLAYLFASKTPEKPEDEGIKDELVLTMEQEMTEKKQHISALEKELEELKNKSKELSNISDSEKESLMDRIDELENNQLKEVSADFLPPIEESEDDIETIDIVETAKETADELLDFAKKAGIAIEVSTAFDHLLVRGNKTRMRIMFRNIIDNSIKYMNRQGKLIITISSIGDDIFIVLKDNGNGLSPDETKHVFELNYQGSNRISGNGLGLTQAKAIVDYYGGTIYAKSNNDKGMGIYIQLPTN